MNHHPPPDQTPTTGAPSGGVRPLTTVLAAGHDGEQTGCVTPSCTRAADTVVRAAWASGPVDISLRCTPCAAQLVLLRLKRGCAVSADPLDAPPASPPGPGRWSPPTRPEPPEPEPGTSL